MSNTRGYLLSWSSQSCSSEVLRLLRGFLTRTQLFSNWIKRILYTCKPIPPRLYQLSNSQHHNHQQTNQPCVKSNEVLPSHYGFIMSTTKWERKRQCVFHKVKFIQFKWLLLVLKLCSSYFLYAKRSCLLYNDGNLVFLFLFYVVSWQN